MHETVPLRRGDAAESPPANAAASALPWPINPSAKDDFVADLTKLAELHAVGALTKEEYEAAKARVLRSSVEGAVADTGTTVVDEIVAPSTVVPATVQAAPVIPRRGPWRAVLPLTLTIGLMVVLVVTAAITILAVSPTSTGKANATKIQTNAAAIEMNRAAELDSAGRHADAEAIYQKVIDTYNGDPDPVTRGNVAIALASMGDYLNGAGRYADALPVFQKVIDTYSADPNPDPDMRAALAGALADEGLDLVHAGRLDDALGSYQKAIDTYSSDTDPQIRTAVAVALLNKGDALTQAGRYADALPAYQKAVDTYSADPNPNTRTLVVLALTGKAIDLADAGRYADALLMALAEMPHGY